MHLTRTEKYHLAFEIDGRHVAKILDGQYMSAVKCKLGEFSAEVGPVPYEASTVTICPGNLLNVFTLQTLKVFSSQIQVSISFKARINADADGGLRIHIHDDSSIHCYTAGDKATLKCICKTANLMFHTSYSEKDFLQSAVQAFQWALEEKIHKSEPLLAEYLVVEAGKISVSHLEVRTVSGSLFILVALNGLDLSPVPAYSLISNAPLPGDNKHAVAYFSHEVLVRLAKYALADARPNLLEGAEWRRTASGLDLEQPCMLKAGNDEIRLTELKFLASGNECCWQGKARSKNTFWRATSSFHIPAAIQPELKGGILPLLDTNLADIRSHFTYQWWNYLACAALIAGLGIFWGAVPAILFSCLGACAGLAIPGIFQAAAKKKFYAACRKWNDAIIAKAEEMPEVLQQIFTNVKFEKIIYKDTREQTFLKFTGPGKISHLPDKPSEKKTGRLSKTAKAG